METPADPSKRQQLEGRVTQALTRMWGDGEWHVGVHTDTVILEHRPLFCETVVCPLTRPPHS